jgi:hypothetical protein
MRFVCRSDTNLQAAPTAVHKMTGTPFTWKSRRVKIAFDQGLDTFCFLAHFSVRTLLRGRTSST